jgi:hypothetical protein
MNSNKQQTMTNNKQQTAVEWLFQETLGITLQLTNKRISHTNWELQMVKLHEQAKEMEKEQMWEYIKNNYCIGHRSLEFHRLEFEEYFEETYGGNK